MIDFSLTEEQRGCQKLVRNFAQKKIVHLAPELDRGQRHSPEIVEKFFKIGLLHYSVPEEYGGAGLGSLEGCQRTGAVWQTHRHFASDSSDVSGYGQKSFGCAPALLVCSLAS